MECTNIVHHCTEVTFTVMVFSESFKDISFTPKKMGTKGCICDDINQMMPAIVYTVVIYMYKHTVQYTTYM